MNITQHDIYSAIEASQEKSFYRWLGASAIGHSCRHYIALQFRCAFDNHFTARILRIFENGHKAEARIVADLEKAGIQVIDQQRMIDAPDCFGHVGVTLDGVAIYKGESAVLEMKTSNSKDWVKLHKDGVQSAKRQHYCQVQFGMMLTGLRQALYVSENKDTGELHVEVVPFNQVMADELMQLAKKIIREPGSPTITKCSDRDDWYECKWCSAFSICKGQELPRVHCLTCAHAKVSETGKGKWFCGLYQSEIPEEHLQNGCGNHIYPPWMVNRKMLDWGEYWVMYEAVNGKDRVCNCPAEDFPKIDGDTEPIIITSQAMREGATKGEL